HHGYVLTQLARHGKYHYGSFEIYVYLGFADGLPHQFLKRKERITLQFEIQEIQEEPVRMGFDTKARIIAHRAYLPNVIAM
ncbi:MAG: hypothetical protein OEZ36_09610, partial [Spirochaetota bacterium]|nr:hypothetical protein [Spirochaetota bacterium]